MTECCCPVVEPDPACVAPPVGRPTCPRCTQPGKHVVRETVQAQVAISLHALIAAPYHFCATPDCPVVYFSADGATHITEAQLRERVFQKHAEDDATLVCYCFRHTVGALRGGDAAAQTAIVQNITLGTQIGRCACTIRNPQGSCCLGNVRRLCGRLTY
jgi:hypothetical protein